LVALLANLSLIGAGILMLLSILVPPQTHAYISSFPLALAGLGYTLLQFRLKPSRGLLLKRLLLAAAFLLWAVVQLLPEGRLSLFLGDAVIAAYVLDLFWMMRDQQRGESD
jgi:hypothetical protein